MNVNRLDLIKSLEIAANALGDNSEPNEKSRVERQSFRINGTKVYATNGEIAIETLLPIDTGTKCYFNGQQFINFLKSLKGEEVTIDFGEKVVKASAGGVSAKFVTIPYSEYEPFPNGREGECFTIEEVSAILTGFAECRRFVAKDKAQGTLSGVRIEKTNSMEPGFILATDRARIAKYDVDQFDFGCTIPTTFIDIMLKYKADVYNLRSDEKFGLIGYFGNSTLATVVYDDRYPDMNKHFPTDAAGSVCVLFEKPQELKAGLDRHIGLLKNADPADRDTTVTIYDQSLKLTTSGKSIGTIEESFVLSYRGISGMETEFCIDPFLLKHSMGECDGFNFYPDTKIILFANEKFHCVMQTRRPVKKEAAK